MKDGFGKALKRALFWHWNLLALGAGVAIAFLSRKPDIVLPAVAAAELGYLGFLGLNDRFQNVLQGKKSLSAKAKEEQKSLESLIEFLPHKDAARFEEIRQRAADLTQIQRRMAGSSDSGASKFRVGSLEKLLWLFLKLLNQRAGIDRFLHATDRDRLAGRLTTARQELAEAKAAGRDDRLINSLAEGIQTMEQRIENYDSAEDNRLLVTAEIDKTEQKIAHVCELGMTSRDPSELSHRIDGIAESVALSERTLADLDLGPVTADDEAPPPFLSGPQSEGSIRLLESE